MDQRTANACRSCLPCWPRRRRPRRCPPAAAGRPVHAPGGQFTAAPDTDPVKDHPRIGGEDLGRGPRTGKRRDLTLEEHQAFWTWAAVHILRDTGIRIEELTELSITA